MLTGWKKLTQDQLAHCRKGEASMMYDSQAVKNFRWQSVCRAWSQIKGYRNSDPCWTCQTISKALGYEYMLGVWRDFAGWQALDTDVDILHHYRSAQ